MRQFLPWALNAVLLCLMIYLFYVALMSPDLVTELRDTSGRWSLYFLLVCLAFTPVYKFKPGWRVYLFLRRHIGLWGFAMALVHLLVWITLEYNWNWADMLKEISNNLFIWLGVLSFILLWVLALTSNRASQRFRGFKAWQMLHQLMYPAVGLGLSHYFMAQKLIEWQPVLLMAIFGLLMLWRYRYAD